MNMIIRRQFLAPSTACGFASVVAPLIAADPADAGVRAGEQVELATRNDSVWGHPTHFPGRSKQPTASLGADRIWVFHRHQLSHTATGMMTVVEHVG
ncbi:hypothetical protein [Rhizobiales bacterium 3FA27D7]|jgi:FtsP/CotA-like multicopper oxidase with cupredoxin domain|uniref:hypothetical protein n=1 Tax=Mesorhizobium sp. 2RAF21 TaxID=3232995 RepID=UPI0010FA5D91